MGIRSHAGCSGRSGLGLGHLGEENLVTKGPAQRWRAAGTSETRRAPAEEGTGQALSCRGLRGGQEDPARTVRGRGIASPTVEGGLCRVGCGLEE